MPVSKSTLSYWLSEIKYIPNELVKARVNSALLKSSITRHERRMNEVKKIKKKAKNTFLSFSKRDMFLFGLGIYLGEGAKMSQRVRIINSDPKVIRFMVRWLAEVFEIPVKNLSLTIHLYPDCNVDESLKYWSKITKIPIKQFRKTQIDIRKNKSGKRHRKLPYGTAHLEANCWGRKDCGVELFRKIMSSIDAILEKSDIISQETQKKIISRV